MANFDQFEISKIDIKQTSVLEFQTNAYTASLTIYFCTVYSASSTNHLPTPLLNSSQMTEHTWGSYPFLNKNSRTLQWFGLDKVSTEIQGFSSNNCNFLGLSRCVQTLHTAHACMTMNHGIPLFICRPWPFWRKSFRFDTSFPDFFFKVGSWKKQVQ